MYISNIQVENFRGITDLNIDLQEGVNLLIGNNGAGKTTLLHAIGIAATQPVSFITGINSMKIQDDARMTTEVVGDAVAQNIFHYQAYSKAQRLITGLAKRNKLNEANIRKWIEAITNASEKDEYAGVVLYVLRRKLREKQLKSM